MIEIPVVDMVNVVMHEDELRELAAKAGEKARRGEELNNEARKR